MFRRKGHLEGSSGGKKEMVRLCGVCVLMRSRNANQEGESQGDWRKYLPGLFKALQLVCGERTVLRVGQTFKITDKQVEFWR